MEKKFDRNQAMASKVEQFRKSQARSGDETTGEEQTPEATTKPAVASAVDLDVINHVGGAIDTSKLADIDRLVDSGLGDDAASHSAQLESIVGKSGIVTSATEMASSGGTFDVFHQQYIPGGNPTYVYPDGSMLTGTAPGVGMVQTVDGSVEHVTVQPGGMTIQHRVDGTTIRTIDGTATNYGPDGVTTTTPGGMSTKVGVDGTVTTTLPNGTVVSTDSNTGNTTSTSPSSGSQDDDDSSTPSQSASGNDSSGDDSEDDDSSDDDDDDSGSDSETETQASSDSGDSGDDSDSESSSDDEGTPNPMNEDRNDGPPIWMVTDSKLGGEEKSAAEKAIDMAQGAGHTTPVEETAAASLEFLTSPLGEQQLKQDVQAIEQAQTGGHTDPSPLDEKASGIPTIEDLKHVEFQLAGGGVVDPVPIEEQGAEVPETATGANLAQQVASVSSDITSAITGDLHTQIDSDDIEINIDVDKIDDVSG